MSAHLSPDRLAILRTVCDTVVPSIAREDDPHGLWARAASDLGVDGALADLLGQLPEEQVAGLGQLLDGLAAQGFLGASQLSREQLLRNMALMGAAAAGAIGTLIAGTLYLHYGLPDPQTGRNPSWDVFGYPGPVSATPQGVKPITPYVPAPGADELTADVVIVGSGAGGGVIAGELSAAGLDVVVLEAGGYHAEQDFQQLELPAFVNTYWRGGTIPSDDGNIALQAGATLGGGTTINWTNCLRTKPWVRDEWASEHGLDGVDGPAFDDHLDAVLTRSGANDRCSDYNGPTQRMHEAAEALGWSWARCVRNTDPQTYSPESAGLIGFGDQTGSKQGTLKTYLQDAHDRGARILVHTRAQRVTTEHGRASGVVATYADPVSGATSSVTVRARHVVVACGALESPALLLRSGIGGPAVGQHLRLHPCTATFGTYAEDQQAWWGPPHSGLVDEFADAEDAHGFLLETAQYTTGLAASSLPFEGAAKHRQAMQDFKRGATFIGLIRDHGSGRVSVDAGGEAVITYALDDPLDVRNAHRGLDAMVQAHVAAGATRIAALAYGAPEWRPGDDVRKYTARVQRLHLGAGGLRLFSAHQMGSCRMGADPATSVAGPQGELHDTPGVWVGDASAFPSASGTNPMITIMALARRTAHALAAQAGTSPPPVSAAPARPITA
ncbi:MAG: oxidoreductase GMC-type [Solirubrobacterales bacterium]|nr:oxidoreductase GMC-type [Solirubrobacterales bacterium]